MDYLLDLFSAIVTWFGWLGFTNFTTRAGTNSAATVMVVVVMNLQFVSMGLDL